MEIKNGRFSKAEHVLLLKRENNKIFIFIAHAIYNYCHGIIANIHQNGNIVIRREDQMQVNIKMLSAVILLFFNIKLT